MFFFPRSEWPSQNYYDQLFLRRHIILLKAVVCALNVCKCLACFKTTSSMNEPWLWVWFNLGFASCETTMMSTTLMSWCDVNAAWLEVKITGAKTSPCTLPKYSTLKNVNVITCKQNCRAWVCNFTRNKNGMKKGMGQHFKHYKKDLWIKFVCNKGEVVLPWFKSKYYCNLWVAWSCVSVCCFLILFFLSLT